MIYTLIVVTYLGGGVDYVLLQGNYKHLDNLDLTYTEPDFDMIALNEEYHAGQKELKELLSFGVKPIMPIEEMKVLWSKGYDIKAITVIAA